MPYRSTQPLSAAPFGHVDRATKGRNALGLERRDGAIHVRLIARANPDIGAFGRERFGDRPADPLGAARDENPGSLESQIHVRFPPW